MITTSRDGPVKSTEQLGVYKDTCKKTILQQKNHGKETLEDYSTFVSL